MVSAPGKCLAPKRCKELFALSDPPCLFEVEPKAEKRGRPKPKTSDIWLPDLSVSPLRSADWATLIKDLGVPTEYDREYLVGQLFWIARSFRDRLVQRAMIATRAEDRAAHIQIASSAQALLSWLESPGAELIDWDTVPLLTPPFSQRPEIWLHKLREILDRLSAEASPGAMGAMAQTAAALAKLLRADERFARTSVQLWAMSTQSAEAVPCRNHSADALKAGLHALLQGGLRAAEMARSIKGGSANSELHLAVAELDKAVFQARRSWLRHNAGKDGEHTGRAASADDRFVVEFCDMVFGTIPACITAQNVYIFRSSAALDALKERIEERNREEASWR